MELWRDKVVLHWKFPDRQPHMGWSLRVHEGSSARYFFPDCLQLQTPLLEGMFGQTGDGSRP